MKNILTLTLLILAMIYLAGCVTKENGSTSEYKKITPEEAKEMMDQDENVVVLDVREQDEFNTGYIEGALLIPDNQIKDMAETTLSDKDATILVYCRSGRRSELATKALNKLGYTNVYDIGGILDWPYEITSQ